MSPLTFPLGASRQIQFNDGSGPEVTTTAIVKRCERWPTEGPPRYVIGFEFVPSTSSDWVTISAFVQPLMRRVAVRSQY